MTVEATATTSRRFPPAWSTLALVGGLALAVASLVVVPGKPSKVEVINSGPGAAGSGGAVGGPGSAASGGGAAAGGGSTGSAQAGPAAGQVAGKQGLACAPGKNGGATDTGVTGDSIKLGATVVESGIGASFLGDVRYGMQAVADKVNRQGGVCGRLLKLKLVDDGWDYQRGGDFIRSLVEGEHVFALAVVPSSEGLKNASDGGYIRSKKIPVVGTDGMLYSQYNDPYIWPVAASTISTMHVMAKHAYDEGARHFSIVYETSYHFGLEGAYAFNAAVERLTKSPIPGYVDPLKNPQCNARFCGIKAGAPSYASEINKFNSACGQGDLCDFTALLLEPSTAVTWMKGGARSPSDSLKMGGPQPLFTAGFGQDCGSACDGLVLWTGYLPPLGDYLGVPAVSEYVNSIKAANSSADFNNSFVEGGYVGMSLLVKSLQAVGPNLTRENLKTVLDAMDWSPGLSAPLRWRPGNHFANVHMRAFSIQYKSGFAGWRDEQVDLDDPWIGQDGHS
jgi:ABC-type branched-subunit amino acid transport system substrate-binding protein